MDTTSRAASWTRGPKGTGWSRPSDRRMRRPMTSTEPPLPVERPWEQGGFFEFPKNHDHQRPSRWSGSILYRTGTDALRGLLSMAQQRGWRRLYVPTYYCQGVTGALRPFIEIEYFDDGPTGSRLDL